MRISDWSSDVCSSDLISKRAPRRVSHPQSNLFAVEGKSGPDLREKQRGAWTPVRRARLNARRVARDRKSVVSGKRVSVRVDLGGRRSIKKQTRTAQTTST